MSRNPVLVYPGSNAAGAATWDGSDFVTFYDECNSLERHDFRLWRAFPFSCRSSAWSQKETQKDKVYGGKFVSADSGFALSQT